MKDKVVIFMFFVFCSAFAIAFGQTIPPAGLSDLLPQDTEGIIASQNNREVSFLFYAPGWHTLQFTGFIDLDEELVTCHYTLLVFIPTQDQDTPPRLISHWKTAIQQSGESAYKPEVSIKAKAVKVSIDKMVCGYYQFELDQLIPSDLFRDYLSDPNFHDGVLKYQNRTAEENSRGKNQDQPTDIHKKSATQPAP